MIKMEITDEEMIVRLKERGLTCSRLNSRIKDSMKDAQDLRKVGLLKPAEAEENVANYLKVIKNKICLLE